MIHSAPIRFFGWLVLLLAALPTHASDDVKDIVRFNQQIRPLLAARCFLCHGPDENQREGGFRLDVRTSATQAADSGERPIVPGHPDTSELMRRITADDPDMRMPPHGNEKASLTDAEIDLLRRWIQQGAPYEPHWSFVRPQRPDPPQVRQADWPRNKIDPFVLAQLEARNLSPTHEATRQTLVRRVTLDLTGLPPTQDEVRRFLEDQRPDAYEALVDRLLTSPAMGERWAQVWLDLARYADSQGYAQDTPRTIWRYRDWVIRAINENKPFDQFTIEQIAGDLLPNATVDQKLATAFHRNTMTNSEGGTDDEEFRVAAVVDRVDTTMQVWMGLTMGCAQCHTHKYDPITQEEYFRVYAIFNQTADRDQPNEAPLLAEYSPEQQAQMDELRRRIEKVKKTPLVSADDPSSRKRNTASSQPAKSASKQTFATEQERQSQLAALEKQIQQIKPSVSTPVMQQLPPQRQRKTHIHVRGDFRSPGAEVTAGVPSVFHSLPTDRPADRLALAHWLVDKENPLTARVIVNRYWEQIFGTGLVETSEDFGSQGALPSHPELLDHLAVEFVEHGWDTQWLLREIVTSATYRQSSQVTPDRQAADPYNRWLSRGPRVPLSAEMVRDQALAVSGLLSRKMFGPSVHPHQPKLGVNAAFGGSTDWTTSSGEDRYRRGLYTFWRRTTPYPSMVTFDAPSREICTVRRIRTNTPLQALVALNDPVFVEAAQALARRILVEAPPDPSSRIHHAFQLVLARKATKEEVTTILDALQRAQAHYREHRDQALPMATDPLGPLPDGMDAAEAASWSVVANILLNLSETLAKR